jgi:hypothetical protein
MEQAKPIYEYTAFCNGPVDVNCSPIVTPPLATEETAAKGHKLTYAVQ